MLQLDSIDNLALTIDQIVDMDSGRISNPDVFQQFAKGITLDEDFLTNDRWAQQGLDSTLNATYVVMQDMLPTIYDAQ